MSDQDSSGVISIVDVLREIQRDQRQDKETLNAIATDMKLFQHEQKAMRRQMEDFTSRLQEVGELSATQANFDMRLMVLEKAEAEREELAKDVRKKIIDVFIGKVLPYVCMAGLAAMAYLQGQKPPGP